MKRMFNALLVASFAVLLGACTQIDTGNVGIESTLGQVKKEVMPPGLYQTIFKTVREISGKEMLIQVQDLKPQTSDKITLQDLDLDIYVQIDPTKAAEIAIRWPADYVEIKGEDGAWIGSSYVTRQAREAVYSAVVKYNSATVHTERSRIADDVLKGLQADLDASAGKGWFFVRSVNVRNLVTDQALEANIKAAAQAQFALQTQKNQLEVAKIEAEKQRVIAQGEADAVRIKAEAVSKQGGAEYVQLQWISKWDGKMPVTQMGNATPMVQIGK